MSRITSVFVVGVLVASMSVSGAATAVTSDVSAQGSHSAEPAQSGGSTIVKTINTSSASLLFRANTSLLTTMFKQGSVLRIVADGTAFGDRVIRFDIGLAYVGGPLLTDPTDAFELRSEMTVDSPGL